MSGYENTGNWTGLQVDALLTKAGTALQPTDDADGLGSGTASDGQVLTADGAGGAAWEDVAATSVTFSPSGDISATNVQAAIEELDDEKMNLAQAHAIALSF
jgi:hypothetical protein